MNYRNQFKRENVLLVRFRSMWAMHTADIPNSENLRKWKRDVTSSFRDSTWWGGDCRSYLEANELLETGWPTGITRIRELGKEIEDRASPRMRSRRIVKRGPIGDELDIHAVNSGNFDKAWRFLSRRNVYRKGAKRGTKARIYIATGADSFRSGEDMFWSPAAALGVGA